MFHTFDICTLLYLKLITKDTYNYISSFFIAAVEGYIHLLSPIKKAANSGNTQFKAVEGVSAYSRVFWIKKISQQNNTAKNEHVFTYKPS